jgi:hypothetical protein
MAWEEACLQNRFIAMAVSAGLTNLAFSRHGTTVECLSLRKNVNCQEHGKSVVNVLFLSETGVGCAPKTSKVKVDSQEVDHVEKPTRVNDDSQEDATTHKSTGST